MMTVIVTDSGLYRTILSIPNFFLPCSQCSKMLKTKYLNDIINIAIAIFKWSLMKKILLSHWFLAKL